MPPFPISHRTVLRGNLRQGARLEDVPGAVARHLESLGFFVAEVDDRRVSFSGLKGGGGLRAPWNFLNQVSGGDIIVVREGSSLKIIITLYFIFYFALATLMIPVFVLVVLATGEHHPALVIGGFSLFWLWTVSAYALTGSWRVRSELRTLLDAQPFLDVR